MVMRTNCCCSLYSQEAIGVPPQVAAQRVATNDRPNAELVAATRAYADVVVPSLPLMVVPTSL